jgi:hypothetical protein
MIDYQKYIGALRKCAKEHEYDRTPTAHIIVSYLCRDTADLLESLEQEHCEDTVSRVKWITKCHGFPPEPTTVCSECGFDRDFNIRARGFGKIKYCPNCGRRMTNS